jgi:hypothetical protein
MYHSLCAEDKTSSGTNGVSLTQIYKKPIAPTGERCYRGDMRTIFLLMLTTAISASAAEPRFQLRSLIQPDGSLLHVRLDTQTGKTWRLQRTLKNRLWTSAKGKATEKKLGEIKFPKVDTLYDFTLAETLEVMEALMKNANDGKAVPMLFLVPAADPAVKRDKVGARIVPPARQIDPGPAGIDPKTGRPFGPVDPNTGLPIGPGNRIGIDPTTGLPIGLGGPGQPPGVPPPFIRGPGGIAIDPFTGLPIGGALPGLPPRGFVPRRLGPPDANTILIRGLKQPLKNQTALGLLNVILNSVDTPLRCVIDADLVYFVPEGATLTLRGGKFSRPDYEENWVEVGEKKKEK